MDQLNQPFKLKTNGFEFDISNEDISEADFYRISEKEFHLIHESESFHTTILEADLAAKKFKVESEGEVFFVEIKDEFDQTLEKMGFNASAGKQIKNIKAPMPGLVLEISVAEGQEVKKDDKLLILEAMKMENSLKIPADAVIKSILVSQGQVVEKGQILIELV